MDISVGNTKRCQLSYKALNPIRIILPTIQRKTIQTNLNPKLWDQVWILNRLVRVTHVYSFLSFYFIQNYILCYLIDMYFSTTFIILVFLYLFSLSTWVNSPLNMTKPFQGDEDLNHGHLCWKHNEVSVELQGSWPN